MIDFIYIVIVLLALIGTFGMMFKKNLVKIAISLNVIGGGLNLFIISLGYRNNGIAPIFTNAPSLNMVSPTPQALILTSIVINLATTAFLLSLAILIYRKKENKLK